MSTFSGDGGKSIVTEGPNETVENRRKTPDEKRTLKNFCIFFSEKIENDVFERRRKISNDETIRLVTPTEAKMS